MDYPGTDSVECRRNVASWGCFQIPLISARGLQLGCASVLYEALVVPVLLYGSEIKVWREKETSRIEAVQVDNLRGFLGTKRIDSAE